MEQRRLNVTAPHFKWLNRLFGSRNTESLIQLSFLGRALPLGQRNEIVKSLVSHQHAYTTYNKTDESKETLKEIEEFAYELFKGPQGTHLIAEDLRALGNTEGACIEVTRSVGG